MVIRFWSILVGVCLVCLGGCGSNIFDSFVDDPKEDGAIDSLQTQLDNAKSQSDYVEIRQKSQAVLNDENASESKKNEARILQSQAVMGQYNITSLDIFADLVDVSENNEDDAVIFDLVKTRIDSNNMPSSDVKLAADLSNTASSGGATLSTTDELNRSLVNIVAVINITETVYDVSSDSISPKSDESTARERLSYLMDPDGDEETDDSVSHYATQASDALTKSNSLSDDEEAEAQKVVSIGQDIALLDVAVKGGAGFEYSHDGQEGTITSSSEDDDIENALNYIFTRSR